MDTKNKSGKPLTRIELVHDELQRYYNDGYKLLNVYHTKKSDDLIIQLKANDGRRKVLKYNCLYPVYKFPTTRLQNEENIFKSSYIMDTHKMDKVNVSSTVLKEIGKINAYDREVWEHFHPEKYIVYNVMRPEYYITTLKNDHLSFEDTDICSLDIEIDTETGEFPRPDEAKHPVQLLTIFDFKKVAAHSFYLDGYNIVDSLDDIRTKIFENLKKKDGGEVKQIDIKLDIFLNKYSDEREMLSAVFDFIENNYDIVVGYNITDFDMAYLTTRFKHLDISRKYEVASDGFSYCFVFDTFFTIDYMSVYKFFVDDNPPSMKLANIAEGKIGISKIETDTFLDIAYNIMDTMLLMLMDKELNLIELMFSFKKTGALLHVFNVNNALGPFFTTIGQKQGFVFVANMYTVYYNIYYNEVYKLINRRLYELSPEDTHVIEMKNLVNFLTHLRQYKNIIEFYTKQEKEKEKPTSDSAGAILEKVVNSIFKKPRKKADKTTKKSKKKETSDVIDIVNNDDCSVKSDDVNEDMELPVITPSKNFDLNDSIDIIIRKLYGLKINTIFSYPGAYNKSFRGVEVKLIDLDFFSMYPVIMFALNISIETALFLMPLKSTVYWIYDKEELLQLLDGKSGLLVYDCKKDKIVKANKEQIVEIYSNEDHIVANSGMIFSKKSGLIPNMCEYFLKVRAKYKTLMSTEEDPVKKNKYNIYQLLYKVYNNSIYGYMGFRYSAIFNRFLVSSVTIQGRAQILYANYKITNYLSENLKKGHENDINPIE